MNKRIDEWADILKEEIDDRISAIISAHKTSYDLCEANVVAKVIRDAGLQDEWEKHLRLQERYNEIDRERDIVKGKLERAKGTLQRELGLPYWSNDASVSLFNVIRNSREQEIMEMFVSLPEGEEIAELRETRSGIDRKLQVASMDKRLATAVRQICDAVGISIEGLED